MTETNNFWSWITGAHPNFRRLGYFLIIISLLYGLNRYVGAMGVVLFIGSTLIFFVVIRNLLSISDSNLLLVLDPESPSVVGVHMIGSKKWAELVTMKGDIVPFTTSAGTHAVFCTSYENNEITTSWIHSIGRTEFLTKSSVYEQSLQIAEDCYKQLSLIRDIPRLMGVKIASAAINVYEEKKLRDISSLDKAFSDDDVIKMLKNLADPLEFLDDEKKIKE